MGDLLSTPSTNPSETQKGIDMSSSSETSQTLQSKPEEAQIPVQASDPPSMEENKTLQGQEQINIEEGDEEGEEEEEEEEGECGFCLYMKGGGCRDSFIAWEKCIEETEKNKDDIVEKCFEVTGMLKKCMEAHSDYYGPILQAEKAAEEVALRELEKDKEKEKQSAPSEQNSAEKGSEERVSKGS
uniref:GCK domain-containing protein n=1 Tax=Davidia involucrata TaxID=16924 RepID=A0A5B6YTG0_DAVIN